jgi:hypothetical protein
MVAVLRQRSTTRTSVQDELTGLMQFRKNRQRRAVTPAISQSLPA